MWKIFERTRGGGDYSIVVARHLRARAMGLCCMVLTDDGSGGGETKVEGKEIAAVFEGHPAESRLTSKKKKKKKKKGKWSGKLAENVAVKGRLNAKNWPGQQVCKYQCHLQ